MAREGRPCQGVLVVPGPSVVVRQVLCAAWVEPGSTTWAEPVDKTTLVKTTQLVSDLRTFCVCAQFLTPTGSAAQLLREGDSPAGFSMGQRKEGYAKLGHRIAKVVTVQA